MKASSEGADFTWSGNKFHSDDVLGSREFLYLSFFVASLRKVNADELRRVGLDDLEDFR